MRGQVITAVGSMEAPEDDTLANFQRSSLLAGQGGARVAPTGRLLQAGFEPRATCLQLPLAATLGFIARPPPPTCTTLPPTIKMKEGGSLEAQQGHNRSHLREHKTSLRGAEINLLGTNLNMNLGQMCH